MGVLANHDDDGDESITKQKVLLAKQWLCTCVLNLATFLYRPLQNNNLEQLSSTYFVERKPQWLISRALLWN